MLKRYLEENVIADIKKKMVFISGPRQVGKTTLAKQIGHIFYPDAYQYFNWHSRSDRKRIRDIEIIRDISSQNKRIRPLKKAPKLYLWDWSEINDKDIRFEKELERREKRCLYQN